MPLAWLWVAAVAAFAGTWLVRSVRDGAFARGLPEYLRAALSLAVTAVGCAALAAMALLVAGADVTAERVTGWAAIGTLAVLVVYWILGAKAYVRVRTRSRV